MCERDKLGGDEAAGKWGRGVGIHADAITASVWLRRRHTPRRHHSSAFAPIARPAGFRQEVNLPDVPEPRIRAVPLSRLKSPGGDIVVLLLLI